MNYENIPANLIETGGHWPGLDMLGNMYWRRMIPTAGDEMSLSFSNLTVYHSHTLQ